MKLRIFLYVSFVFFIHVHAEEQEIVELEIVPFKTSDISMKEQWLAMVTDQEDEDVQKWMPYSQQDIKRAVLRSNDWFKILVLRVKGMSEFVLGFIEFDYYDSLYFWKLRDEQGFWVSKKSTHHDGCKPVAKVDHIGFINGIVVHKDYRSCGVMQLLLHAVEQDCKNKGINKLMLFIRADHEKALYACIKYGFEILPQYSIGKGIYMMKSIQ